MKVAVIPSRFIARDSTFVFDFIYATGGPGTKSYPSVEALPRWIQERYAVLRLLNEDEIDPLGTWKIDRATKKGTLYLYIVRQPGDPKWEK